MKSVPNTSIMDRLAVCSWSLQPDSPRDLVAKLRDTGLQRVQLALDPLRDNPGIWSGAGEVLHRAGYRLVSGMFGCVGEDYSTLESIRLTGGIAPHTTWEQNLKNARAAATLATSLGLGLVTFHAGFLPHEESDPASAKLRKRVATVCDIFRARQIEVALETGQESALVLAMFLQTLDCPNVGVNFDPANMLLYGQGDPVAAVRVLEPWIRQVHIKDANRSRLEGAWGEEVPVGTGQVDWPAFFAALREVGYAGDFVIEREAGNQRLADVRTAQQVILNFVE